MVSAAAAAAMMLAGCQTDGTFVSGKHTKPLSPEMVAVLEKKQMPKDSPILVRIFKQEAELEIWKQDTSGRYALLKTYPVCRWSGELGPKIKEGDRQAPEGFYSITPAQMNPNSQFYLAFNLGYPNAFDKAHGRTGAHLMVHGDCSSRGCYAMTDDQISEIYALGRESFFGGQRAFQVQAYPFRMTAANMAKHRANPHMAFWKMLKEGNDHFEVTRLEPKVDVCEKRYVFNAEPPANATPVTRPLSAGPWGTAQAQTAAPVLKFNPTGRCPAYQVDPEIAAALATKKQADDTQYAELLRRGTPVAPVRTGVDGGMHPTFLAKLKPTEVKDADGSVRMVLDEGNGKPLGTYVNPPREAGQAVAVAAAPVRSETTASVPSSPAGANRSAAVLASSESRPAQPSTPKPAVPAGNLFTRLFSSDDDPKPPPPPAAKPPEPPAAKPLAKPAAAPQPTAKPAARPVMAAPAAAAPAKFAAPPAADSRPSAAPQRAAEMSQTERKQPPAAGLMSGATPVMPAGTFESRWGGFR